MTNELNAEEFIEKAEEARTKPNSTLNMLADMRLKLNVEQPDHTFQSYFGPNVDSMPWNDYMDFLVKLKVL